MSSIDYRGLPSDVEAEKLILSGIIVHEADVQEISSLLMGDDFALESHRRIWFAVMEIFSRGDPIDYVTVAREMGDKLQSIGGLAYLTSLDDGMPRVPNLDHYCRIVKEKSILRRTAIKAHELMERCTGSTPSTELLGEAERFLRDLQAENSERAQYGKMKDRVIEKGGIDKYLSEPDPGIPTPFPALNRVIVGFKPGELIVIGARPGTGKTAFAQQVGYDIARQGVGSVLFSLEMSPDQIDKRALAEKSGLSMKDIRNPDALDLEARRNLQRAMVAIYDLPFWTTTKARSTSAIHAMTRRMMAQEKPAPQFVIVDHLHLIRSAGRQENRNTELARITSDLKTMAEEFQVSIMLLAQLNRESEKEGRTPQMSDLRDCGAIEQDADMIFFLHRKSKILSAYVDFDKPVEIDLIVAKQRNGIAYIRLPMLFFGRYFRFVECEDRPDEQ